MFCSSEFMGMNLEIIYRVSIFVHFSKLLLRLINTEFSSETF